MKNEIEQASQRFAADIAALMVADVMRRLEGEPVSVPSVTVDPTEMGASSWTFAPVVPSATSVSHADIGRMITGRMEAARPKALQPVPRVRVALAPQPTAKQVASMDAATRIKIAIKAAGPKGAATSELAKAAKVTPKAALVLLGRLIKTRPIRKTGATKGTRWVAAGVR